ncbi:MAG: hypothetical protein GY953_45590 [bacterium]|nr:hypothetical protein [bacterium]
MRDLLILEGGPYERGRQLAAMRGQEVLTSLATARRVATRALPSAAFTPEKLAQAEEVGRHWLDRLPERTIEELEGFADGCAELGLSFSAEEYVAGYALFELIEHGCCVWVAEGSATRTGEVIQFQVFDYPLEIASLSKDLVRLNRPPPGSTELAFASWGSANPCAYVVGFNEAGLSISGMSGNIAGAPDLSGTLV